MKKNMNNKKRLVLSIAVCMLFIVTIFFGVGGKDLKPKDKPDLDWDYWTNPPHIFSNVTGNVGIGTDTPKEKLDVDGNIAVSGTIDGRDVSADGEKLDAIEVGATADVHQIITDFVVASDESVTAGDIVSFLDGYVYRGYGATRDSSEYVFNSGLTSHFSCAEISSSKFVIAYEDIDNFYYATVCVGEVNDGTISFGDEVVFYYDNSLSFDVAVLDTATIVLTYIEIYSHIGYAVLADVVWDYVIPHYGYEEIFHEEQTGSCDVTALTSTKFVVAYMDNSNNFYGTAIVGEVTNGGISFGDEYVFNDEDTGNIDITSIAENKFVVVGLDNYLQGVGFIGTVDSLEISFGQYAYTPGDPSQLFIDTLSSSKIVLAYREEYPTCYGAACIGDVSGEYIRWGGIYYFSKNPISIPHVVALSSTEFVIAFIENYLQGQGKVTMGIVTDDTITFNTPTLYTPDSNSNRLIPLSSTEFVIAYSNLDNFGYGTTKIGDIHFPKLIGVAKDSGESGDTIHVILDGISEVHSGLTPGMVYYSSPAGMLTVEKVQARIGMAISSNEILLEMNREELW